MDGRTGAVDAVAWYALLEEGVSCALLLDKRSTEPIVTGPDQGIKKDIQLIRPSSRHSVCDPIGNQGQADREEHGEATRPIPGFSEGCSSPINWRSPWPIRMYCYSPSVVTSTVGNNTAFLAG